MIVFDASAKENGPNLTFSWRRPSSMDWFLYDNGLRHERVKWDRQNKFWQNSKIIYLDICIRGQFCTVMWYTALRFRFIALSDLTLDLAWKLYS